MSSPFDASTCLITTNAYEQTFEQRMDREWIARSAAEGPCGIVEETTLRDGGGIMWSMEIRKMATAGRGSPACARVDTMPETYSSEGIRRQLPCTAVQPGAIPR